MWKTLIISCLLVGFSATDSPKKCCPESTVLLRKKSLCWNPTFNETSKIESITCKSKVRLVHYTISSKGELVLAGFNKRNITIEPDTFCLGNQTTIKDVGLKNLTQVALVCSEEQKRIIADEVTGYCMIVSVVFLLITAAIYAALPQLRDLLGKSLISFCCTFAIGLAIMGISKLTTYSDMTLCAIRGFLMYYFILSAMFWTNAMSIQILLCIRRPSTMNYKWRDFAWYALYAWGCPAVLTLVMALVNFLPGDHPRPGIGLMHCWFYDTAHTWYYMYSVWSILITANIGIFIYTSVSLWRNTFATSHLKALRYKFLLTIRLFIVMGITWIFEMISSLVDEITIFWAIMDIYNVLQGVTIFLVLVVFRRRVIKAMYKQGWLDCISEPVEKYLAKADDDEQDVVEHTKEVPLEDRQCL